MHAARSVAACLCLWLMLCLCPVFFVLVICGRVSMLCLCCFYAVACGGVCVYWLTVAVCVSDVPVSFSSGG